MPVSGVLILVYKNSNAIQNLLNSAEKVYNSKVKGKFSETATVDQPIG